MSSLYYFNPLSITQEVFRKDVLAWSKLYNLITGAVGMNDRTNILEQPIKLSSYSRCRLPIISSTNITYDGCLDERAHELFQLSKTLNKPLGIMWSGGIDSTCVLVSFLRNFSLDELKGQIKIITSIEATFENPEFYKKYILPNFEIINGENIPWLFDKSMLLVSGEFNDQLFGSDLIRVYLTNKGKDEINGPFNKDQIFNYINSKVDDPKVSTILIDSIIDSSKLVGVNLEKNNDFFWWYNFCFKWQAVHFRLYALIFPKFFDNVSEEFDRTYVHHFFQTDNFQLWSINNPQVRYITDWKNYKQLAKDSIYAFDKNDKYFINKIKRPSLQTVFYHRPVIKAVTNDFKVLEEYNLQDFYNPKNMFR